jgi:hypothetical protein
VTPEEIAAQAEPLDPDTAKRMYRLLRGPRRSHRPGQNARDIERPREIDAATESRVIHVMNARDVTQTIEDNPSK